MAVVMPTLRLHSSVLFISPKLVMRGRNITFKRSMDDVGYHGGCYVRRLHTSSFTLGLEEFFPPGVLDTGELSPESVKTGRRWHAGELRGKSNEDLQKLWYVLLKERNMLNTLMHEAKRNGVPMPSPERYHKVKKSMAVIKLVISERERVLKELEKQTWAFDVEQEDNPAEELETQEQMPSEKDVLLTERPPNKEGIFATLQRKIFARIWGTT